MPPAGRTAPLRRPARVAKTIGELATHRPRASGKSTRVFRACEQLCHELCVMRLTLQELVVKSTSPEAFWRTVVRGQAAHVAHDVVPYGEEQRPAALSLGDKEPRERPLVGTDLHGRSCR